jgi:hypothetical protein
MLKQTTVFFLLLIVSFQTKAQCNDFVKTKGFKVLNTDMYVPEGRFDAMTLSQGDYLKVYKSFFRGKTYKVVVIADKKIPGIKFRIKTMQGEIIYDSNKDPNSQTWEYTSDKNQNLIIKVEIPPARGIKPESGCVAVILGYKI